ncbi:MAG: Gfo/Idh/MocA family oxidoreductase [Ideonella sp.]|nr:Gfo/Idh/MocA family oxidoreductase [Ideonella sp.]MCC7459366.1 bi-domain-containing oxidoreductase [Nitrospira sp.]
MKQVTHRLKDGRIEVVDVPVPTLTDGFVLVRTAASVISAGTEKTKIDMGQMSLMQKARARPDLVKQVVRKIRSEGLGKTLGTVNTRLGAANPLGYSSAGVALVVGGMVEGIRPGDRVACGGVGYANHAELAVVPKNLLVRVPETVSDEEAAFATLGAIALQGVRLAEPKLGETVLVLGLGLLGQITVQLLRAAGCRVLCLDLDASLTKLAERFGGISVSSADAESACRELSGGHGVDAVLVCAGTSSNQPIELCGRVVREKGRVVVVGVVRMDIPREDFFKKEISVVISRSYGPGRYDPRYEENGNDYPIGYVRFTEQRNMQTVIDLIAERKLDVRSLITHRFAVDDAVSAYQLIEGEKREPYLGIVLTYSGDAKPAEQVRAAAPPPKAVASARVGVSLIGAGNYATATLLPVLRTAASVELREIATSSGRTADSVAKQFGFRSCAAGFDDLLAGGADAVLIATRHNTHADYASKALRSGRHVYVEKPLAMTMEELTEVARAFGQGAGAQLMIGFNRRWSPLTREANKHFDGVRSPLMVNIRVNAGFIPPEHWIQDPRIGGGRLIGEACHFIDLASALTGSDPVEVHAAGMAKAQVPALLNDNVCITLRFANGSVATINYVADGSKSMPKERVEIFGGDRSAVIDDFREATFYQGDASVRRSKLASQDKGQRAMLEAWVDGLLTGRSALPFETAMAVSAATIAAVESLGIGLPIPVSQHLWQLPEQGVVTPVSSSEATAAA